MEINKFGEYTFKVLPFEVDFRGTLTVPHLTNYILNCAGYHAEECGFGVINNVGYVSKMMIHQIID